MNQHIKIILGIVLFGGLFFLHFFMIYKLNIEYSKEMIILIIQPIIWLIIGYLYALVWRNDNENLIKTI